MSEITKDLELAIEDAIREIEYLRRQNEVLQAKVDTMNLFAAVLYTKPYSPSQGFGEDQIYRLRRKLAEAKGEVEKEQEKQPKNTKI